MLLIGRRLMWDISEVDLPDVESPDTGPVRPDEGIAQRRQDLGLAFGQFLERRAAYQVAQRQELSDDLGEAVADDPADPLQAQDRAQRQSQFNHVSFQGMEIHAHLLVIENFTI